MTARAKRGTPVTQDTSPGCLAALPPDAAARTLVAEGGR
jgi:hypothetical protein